MSMSRRGFLSSAITGTAATAAAAVTGGAGNEAQALGMRHPKEPPKDAVGLLYDGTLCVGCKACVKACKEANDRPAEISAQQAAWNPELWDSPIDLSAKTFNIIKVYQHGTMATKDAEVNGYAFSKRQCLHCIDPSCVSACPVSALTKDPLTGIVGYDADRCLGCRFCVWGCPYGVPKFEYDKTFGQIRKCELCRHRLAKGELPACVDVCPTGATLFGRLEDLKTEAHRRLTLKPGERTEFPRGDVSGKLGGSRPGHEKLVEAKYQQHVYGEKEMGGTQCLALSAVPFEKLNLPTGVPEYSYPAVVEGLQESVYQNMLTPAVVLAGLVALAKRNVHPGDVDD
ncbi:hydrogenase 2 iron-sulfur protein [uncultured Gammaproteobacteria bacterium]